jgi:hypothetical protein
LGRLERVEDEEDTDLNYKCHGIQKAAEGGEGVEE